VDVGLVQVAADRRNRLKRFGEAVKETATDSVTVRQAEDIPFERMQKARQTTEEKRAEKEDLKSALAGSDKSAVVGRCGPHALMLRVSAWLACRAMLASIGDCSPSQPSPWLLHGTVLG
jgi:hypothetical protein